MTSAARIRPTTSQGILCPPQLRSSDDLGIPYDVVGDLVLKILYLRGSLSGRDLAANLHLPFALVQPAVRALGDAGHVTSAGTQGMRLREGENVFSAAHWVLSLGGEQRARELMARNEYAGPAPVPLETYSALARLQAPDPQVSEEDLRSVLSHLVLGPEVYDSLGPALNSRHTVFLYGPPGNGKTAIADACSNLLGPPIFVPHALYAHGEIIRFLDPVHHVPADNEDVPPHDERWVLVRRPEVKVGGEMGAHSLELSFDARAGYHDASTQLKANGGTFLVDDFGRQSKVTATEILNRLIVPLEKGIDYINVARVGTTVAVPFTTTLILSTNLVPEDLMDEALLRRLRFKVLVSGPSEAEYREIWRNLCAENGIEWRPASIDSLIETHYRPTSRRFRGVHPRDLLSHVASAARYRRQPVELSPELVDSAARAYFVQQVKDW